MLALRPFCDLEIRLGAPLELGTCRRRDRGVEHADVQGREPEQRVLQIVARQDRERPLRRDTALVARASIG